MKRSLGAVQSQEAGLEYNAAYGGYNAAGASTGYDYAAHYGGAYGDASGYPAVAYGAPAAAYPAAAYGATASYGAAPAKRQAPSRPNDDTNLMVNYLPKHMTEETLQGLFAPYGEVEKCTLIKDQGTNESKCYGFIKYATAECARQAVAQLHGFEIEGKRLRVALASCMFHHPSPSPHTIVRTSSSHSRQAEDGRLLLWLRHRHDRRPASRAGVAVRQRRRRQGA